MTVNVPLTVSVVGVDNSPFEGIMVELYKDGILQTNDDLTNENGAVVFTLNDGTYQFAANLSNTLFWSEPCTMPGCTDQTIVLPGGQSSIAETMISYEYDDLYRLTEANYDNGLYYHYAYDAVGNRLTETTQNSSTSYTYDIANRLTGVNGVTYTWDNNGNLLNDGTAAYTYDYNNKLVGLTQGTDVYQYAYNGLGDRIRQIVNGVTTDYVLDINTGLTQVLQDGTNTYLYGVNRVSQATATETEYFLPDALGSVRNLTDENAANTLTQSYTPFGEVLESSGAGQTGYAFTGEMYDPTTGLVYLRARYYNPGDGRFVSRDTWVGDQIYAFSYNKWIYGYENPINITDPSGLCPDYDGDGKCDIGWQCEKISDPGHRQLCYQRATCQSNICPAPPKFISTGTPIYKSYKQLVETPCKLEGDNLSPWWKTKGALGNEYAPLDQTMLVAILVYTEASPIRAYKNDTVGKEWIGMAGNRLAFFCEYFGGCGISKDGRELQEGLRKFLSFSARYPEYANQSGIKRLLEKKYDTPEWAFQWAKEIVKPRKYNSNKPFGGFNSQSIPEQKYFYSQYQKNMNKSTEMDGVYFSWGSVKSNGNYFGDMFLLTYSQIQYHFTYTDFLIGTTSR